MTINLKNRLLAIIFMLFAFAPAWAMDPDTADDSSSSSHSRDSSECSSDLDSDELDLLTDTEQTRSPLMKAALAGDYALCKQLLMAGAEINQQTFIVGKTALHFAAQAGHASILKLLLAHGANPYFKHYGEREKHGNRYAGSCMISPRYLARENNHPEIEPIIKEHKTILVNLFEACAAGNIQFVEKFLHKYRIADVAFKMEYIGIKNRARTPLMIAARNGHIELCQLLLAHGADPRINDEKYVPVQARSIDLFGHNERVTASTHAQRNDHAEIVALLEHHQSKPLSLKQLAVYELHDQLDAGKISRADLKANLPSELMETYF
jgi:ankyrin repeat protein